MSCRFDAGAKEGCDFSLEHIYECLQRGVTVLNSLTHPGDSLGQ